jgi:uncharacterized membrane protein
MGAAPAGAVAGTATVAPAAGGMSDTAASALCYVLGLITGILFLVIAPYNQNKTVRFHAFQSIFLNVAWIGLWIAMHIVGLVLLSITWTLATVWGLVSMLVGLAFFGLWIYMIIAAVQGKKVMLPVIGALAEKQA